MFKNKLVLLASFFTNMGIVLIMPITTIFIHKTLNKSLVVAGFVLMIFPVAMMAGNLLGGFLFDHWKEKLSMYLGGTLIIISLSLITLFPIWAVYSFLVVAYGIGLGILNSNINGYIAFLKSDDQQIFNNN
ncbi:MFS transporter [Oenococcus sp. UCMA 16435]|nr:MFS transporter [Oenococcus sp. UCMA 16435]MDI4583781.1 MFS transporter [Oenococcus sp. UCMA 14587]